MPRQIADLEGAVTYGFTADGIGTNQPADTVGIHRACATLRNRRVRCRRSRGRRPGGCRRSGKGRRAGWRRRRRYLPKPLLKNLELCGTLNKQWPAQHRCVSDQCRLDQNVLFDEHIGLRRKLRRVVEQPTAKLIVFLDPNVGEVRAVGAEDRLVDFHPATGTSKVGFDEGHLNLADPRVAVHGRHVEAEVHVETLRGVESTVRHKADTGAQRVIDDPEDLDAAEVAQIIRAQVEPDFDDLPPAEDLVEHRHVATQE